eukprot:scaffold224604_cov32-Tisochrysis_lutea.AAC.1
MGQEPDSTMASDSCSFESSWLGALGATREPSPTRWLTPLGASVLSFGRCPASDFGHTTRPESARRSSTILKASTEQLGCNTRCDRRNALLPEAHVHLSCESALPKLTAVAYCGHHAGLHVIRCITSAAARLVCTAHLLDKPVDKAIVELWQRVHELAWRGWRRG